MCETSNMPACSRTALCSWLTPAYCTGISQPAKGTMRPPARWWAEKSGVLFERLVGVHGPRLPGSVRGKEGRSRGAGWSGAAHRAEAHGGPHDAER